MITCLFKPERAANDYDGAEVFERDVLSGEEMQQEETPLAKQSQREETKNKRKLKTSQDTPTKRHK